MAPVVNTSNFCKAGFFNKRKPNGANSQTVDSIPACSKAICTASREDLIVFTRTSKGADRFNASVNFKASSSPYAPTKAANHSSGKLLRTAAGKPSTGAFKVSLTHVNSSSAIAACKLSISTTFCAASNTKRRSNAPAPVCAKCAKTRRWRNTAYTVSATM